MKRTSIALAIGLMASGSAFANTFVNGGFEDGNLGSLDRKRRLLGWRFILWLFM